MSDMPAAARKTLYFHVGHGKTGSSYLQSCFALSIDGLASCGISYPIAGTSLERGSAGHVSEGNLPPVTRDTGHTLEQLAALLEMADPACTRGILISNEALFYSMLRQDFLATVKAAYPQFDIKVLLFIRDPLDHAVSAFQQQLKGGLGDDITVLLRNIALPQQVARFLGACEKAGLDVTVFNYNKHKKDLHGVTEGWLGLPAGTLTLPPRAKVNRSLSRSEMMVQRAFIKHIGRHARVFVADALSNALPEIEAEKPHIPEPALSEFLDRMRAQVKPANRRIPAAEAYVIPTLAEAQATLPAEEESVITLTPEQIDVIARSLVKFIKPRYVTAKDQG
jgi:hypothetical protein